jgi:hypothetical protein
MPSQRCTSDEVDHSRTIEARVADWLAIEQHGDGRTS